MGDACIIGESCANGKHKEVEASKAQIAMMQICLKLALELGPVNDRIEREDLLKAKLD